MNFFRGLSWYQRTLQLSFSVCPSACASVFAAFSFAPVLPFSFLFRARARKDDVERFPVGYVPARRLGFGPVTAMAVPTCRNYVHPPGMPVEPITIHCPDICGLAKRVGKSFVRFGAAVILLARRTDEA